MKVVILVPYRKGDEHRERAWTFVEEWWDQFGWPLFTGPGPAGKMNRSAAKNEAARMAEPWDVAVFGDADTIGEPDKIRLAVDHASEGVLAYPFTRYHGLSPQGTLRLIAGQDKPNILKRKWNSPGGIFAIGHALWDEVGGFDEGFVGWGYEDLAFAYAASTLGGSHRQDGVITHLWHPIAPEKKDSIAGRNENRARLEQYRAAKDDPDKMRQVLRALRSD